MISSPHSATVACLGALLGCAPAQNDHATGASPPGSSAPAAAADAPARPPVAAGPRYKPSSSSKSTVPIADNAYGAYGAAPDAPEIGDIAEDFELPTVDGGTFKLADARKAGPVVVMFYRGFW